MSKRVLRVSSQLFIYSYFFLLPMHNAYGQGAVIPVTNPKAPEKGPVTATPTTEKVETEIIEVFRLGAGPSELRRNRPGKFVLLVIDRTKDPNAAYRIVRKGSEDTPIAKLAGSRALGGVSQVATILDEAPGTLLLEAAATGRVLCTITIAE